jgi:hypothetical protein
MKVQLALLAVSLMLGATGSTAQAQSTATSPPASWNAIKPYAKVKISGNEFEAECGPTAEAIQQIGQVIHFQMIPGNKWVEDSSDSERTELDGYRQRLTPGASYWAAWSLYVEPGTWSSSDWLVLEQMPGLWGHIIQKGAHAMSFFLTNVSAPLARLPVESGVWYNFVEKYVVGSNGAVASWVNGKQVANYTGSVGSGGSYYPKLGIYRGNQTAAGLPVVESIGARYANFKFGTADLSALISTPDPVPALVRWP